MYAYCVFCETQRCKIIATLLERKGVGRAFAPQIVHRERKQGVNLDKTSDLLPGYVFLFTEEPLPDGSCFQGINGVHRRLGEPQNGYVLTGADEAFAMHLLARDGMVGAVRMVRVGERVTVDDPLFKDCQGTVTKIDFRKERARVDFIFNNMSCHTWIACERISLHEAMQKVAEDAEAAEKEATDTTEENDTDNTPQAERDGE